MFSKTSKYKPKVDEEFKKLIFEYEKIALKISNRIDTSNVVGEYAEMLVCDLLKLDKYSNSNKDTDAHKGKEKYQIKSRWYKPTNNSGQDEFGYITKNDKNYPFKYLILVYFNVSLSDYKIFQIDSAYINAFSERKESKFIYEKEKNGKKVLIFKYNKMLENEAKRNKEVKLLYPEVKHE